MQPMVTSSWGKVEVVRVTRAFDLEVPTREGSSVAPNSTSGVHVLFWDWCIVGVECVKVKHVSMACFDVCVCVRVKG